MPAAQLAPILGRTVESIFARRNALGIKPPFNPAQRPWKSWEIKLLGTKPDRLVAERLGRSPDAVQIKRSLLGISSPGFRPWTKREEAIIRKVPDAEAARQLGRSRKAIVQRRRALGLA